MNYCKRCKKELNENNRAKYKIAWLNDKLLYCMHCVMGFREKTARSIVPKMTEEQKETARKKATKKLKRKGIPPEDIEKGLREAGL